MSVAAIRPYLQVRCVCASGCPRSRAHAVDCDSVHLRAGVSDSFSQLISSANRRGPRRRTYCGAGGNSGQKHAAVARSNTRHTARVFAREGPATVATRAAVRRSFEVTVARVATVAGVVTIPRQSPGPSFCEPLKAAEQARFRGPAFRFCVSASEGSDSSRRRCRIFTL